MGKYEVVRSILKVLVMACTFLWVEALLSAAPDNDESTQIKRWHALYQKRAEVLKVTQQQGTEERPLTLFPTPLQAYSNSVRPDQVHGAVYLWTAAGRPRM